LVTGAANGLGLAMAENLVAKGYQVWALDTDKQQLRKLESQYPEQVNIIPMDVGDTLEWRNMAIRIKNHCPNLKLVVANAGVSVLKSLQEQSLDDVEWITRINYLGTVYAVKSCLPLLLEQPKAHIITIGSAAGVVGFPEKTTYCGSKFGVRGFTEALTAELQPTNVQVTHVVAGPISTGMLTRSRVENEETRSRVQQYLRDKGMPVDRAAKIIIETAFKGKSIVLLTQESKTTHLLKRIFPSAFPKLLGKYKDKLPA